MRLRNCYGFKLLLACFTGLLLTGHDCNAADIIQARMVRNPQDVFEMWVEMQLQANHKRVYQLLTDFDQLHKLSDFIKSSKRIAGKHPQYTVEIISEGCVLWFCKRIRQTQRVTELGDGDIMVEDIPAQSDFTYASSLWQVRAQAKGTRVALHAELKPDFWLPPVVGSWLFRKKMLRATQQLLQRLEKLAQEKTP